MLIDPQIIAAANAILVKVPEGCRICPGCGKLWTICKTKGFPHWACCGWDFERSYDGCATVVVVNADYTTRQLHPHEIREMRSEFEKGEIRGIQRRETTAQIVAKLIG